MSYLKKQYAPAKFWYMEYTLRRGSVLHEAVPYILFISNTKSVYNDFKATIQKYFIQINIKINIDI